MKIPRVSMRITGYQPAIRERRQLWSADSLSATMDLRHLHRQSLYIIARSGVSRAPSSLKHQGSEDLFRLKKFNLDCVPGEVIRGRFVDKGFMSGRRCLKEKDILLDHAGDGENADGTVYGPYLPEEPVD